MESLHTAQSPSGGFWPQTLRREEPVPSFSELKDPLALSLAMGGARGALGESSRLVTASPSPCRTDQPGQRCHRGQVRAACQGCGPERRCDLLLPLIWWVACGPLGAGGTHGEGCAQEGPGSRGWGPAPPAWGGEGTSTQVGAACGLVSPTAGPHVESVPMLWPPQGQGCKMQGLGCVPPCPWGAGLGAHSCPGRMTAPGSLSCRVLRLCR